MRIILAILFLGLVSSTLAFINVKKVPSTIIDTSFLKNKQSDRKLSFHTITNFMQQPQDVSKIVEFLKDLQKQVADNRKEKLAIIEQTRSQCSDEEDFRNQAISEGERGAAAAQSQLNLCTSQKEQAQHLRDLASSALAVYQGDLQDLDDARDTQTKTFQDRSKKLQDLSASLQKLQNLLDQYEAEATGATPSTLFIQTTNKLLKHSVSTGHSHLILPVYTKLLQMHVRQEFDADSVATIRQILANLEKEAADALQELNDDETKNKANYDAARERLTGLVTRLTSQVANSDQFSGTMDQCITQETSILELSNDKVERNTELLSVSQELCKAAEEQWRLSELSRTKEVNIINALLGAVNRFEADYEQDNASKIGDLINVRT